MEWENPQDTSNQSEWSWEDQWEPPVFGGAELACVTGVCVLLLATGIMGNMLTILVVWLRPQLRSSTYLYLSSMAVSDLLILFLMPLDLYKLWHPRPWRLGDLVCKVSMFASESCTFSSLLHITALSLERYLAVCRPLAAKTLLTRRRTRALIGCLWGAALLSAAPVLLMVGVEELGAGELGAGELGAGELGAGEGRGGSECRCTDYAVSSGLLATMMWLSNLYFLVPLGILGLVYGLIGRKLWLRPLRNSRDRAQRNTVKMLGMIVLVFVLCWLPFHVGRTLFSLSLGSTPGVYHTHNHTHTHTHSHTHTERLLEEENEPEAEFQADVLYYVSQYFNLASFVLFYLSAAVNPLLYNTMSARYRQALRSLLHTHSRTHTHSHTHRSRLPPLTPQHSTTTL